VSELGDAFYARYTVFGISVNEPHYVDAIGNIIIGTDILIDQDALNKMGDVSRSSARIQHETFQKACFARRTQLLFDTGPDYGLRGPSA
jgi:hypothetical protein